MQVTVGRWGDSLALRLPRELADEARLVEGSTIALEVDRGGIRVAPVRRRLRLAELLEGEPPAEFDWGRPTGAEAW